MSTLRNALAALTPSLALALAATFFGIAAYISIAEQPARLALADGPLLALHQLASAGLVRLQTTPGGCSVVLA